ncbi:MAG: tetratricopeptide repeat protein [Candidatus Latescibacterota bacterium]|nr:MAG: tetratricopeptide repeat protein [Candidatus Latescibacterota bacterium]
MMIGRVGRSPERDGCRSELVGLAVAMFVALVVLVLSGPGCAYFNTFYNAKRIYKEAQETPRAKDGSVGRSTIAQYEEVIKKCESLITTYPNSKYVDDAILMIGKCFYEIGDYGEAITKFDELQSNFPDSKLNKEGQLYAAKSYHAKDDVEKSVVILQQLAEDRPEGELSDEVLFLLGTSLISVGQEDQAVRYLETLATNYPNSTFRVSADLEAADLYADRGEYEKSLAIYDRLRNVPLGEADTVRFLRKLAEVYVKMGDFEKGLLVFDELGTYMMDPTDKAPTMLLLGEAYTGMDSLALAIDTYKSVAATYPRSMFSAEAYFHLGEIYQEKFDSLQVAQSNYESVRQQYANSPFAEEAIARSVSISKFLRLQASLDGGGEEGQAAVQFDLAEIELLQFENYEKALKGYRKILDEFPDSELAPKAAYAVAYIYDIRLDDAEKAREAYQYLVERYPNSQQAVYARIALGLPPLEEGMTVNDSTAVSDSTIVDDETPVDDGTQQ